MERLTTNKSVADMSMIELAHNSCYADDERNARYRDYNLDVDSRWLIRNLVKDICGEDFNGLSDEEVDEYMASMLSVEIDSTIGLLALFYRNLWAMADLREKLKYYEDADEQGLLLRLPCKVGDEIFLDFAGFGKDIDEFTVKDFHLDCFEDGETILFCDYESNDKTLSGQIDVMEFEKSVFLTRAEAEAKLKEMEEKDGR
ncbi:hypothetical protein [Roseburia inulinivorans]|jgi:hypothetical protein|uniref:hypothetical protein n=1 Tax=Roseburia inulinivorans TaxID=360807 RepID=UPI002490C91F|nr:hypothetical protein [Roseburia inulinivorans]